MSWVDRHQAERDRLDNQMRWAERAVLFLVVILLTLPLFTFA